MKKQKPYLVESAKNAELIYFNTVWAKNVPHINIGTEEEPYYLPQEMFNITDETREYLTNEKIYKTKN